MLAASRPSTTRWHVGYGDDMTTRIRQWRHVLVGVLGAGILHAACMGDEPGSGAAEDVDASVGASSGNASSGSSGAPGDANATCTAPNTCDGSSLVRCDGVALGVCALGCANGTCTSFDPTGPLGAEELSPFGLNDVVLDDNLVFDTDDGSVFVADSTGGLVPLRAPNASADYAVSAGIGYRRAADRGIFFFESFEVRHGTRRNFRGALPLAVVARRSIVVSGVWTLPCGALGALTSGKGAGQDAATGGGGGGGRATAGGNGRISCYPFYNGTSEAESCLPGGEGGAGGDAVPATVDWALVGGSKGGDTGANAGAGGGAAVQLVSLGLITIGPGAADAPAGINVGGCGGLGSGPGGGAGGTLILETPVLNALAHAGLAANGGAGAPEGPPAGDILASDGQLSKTAWAVSPSPVGCSAQGGYGGTDSTPPGNAPGHPDASCGQSPNFTLPGGGGGGSVGFLHVVTRNAAPVTRDPAFFVSPEWSIATLPQ